MIGKGQLSEYANTILETYGVPGIPLCYISGKKKAVKSLKDWNRSRAKHYGRSRPKSGYFKKSGF